MTTRDKDSPLSQDKDKSLIAIHQRYRKANEMAIATSNRIVFESLCDIPILISMIENLEKKLDVARYGNE